MIRRRTTKTNGKNNWYKKSNWTAKWQEEQQKHRRKNNDKND